MGDEKDFRVIDRRGERAEKGKGEPPPAKAAGEGFTMEEKETPPAEPMQIDFPTFIFSLATSALIHSGYAPDSAGRAEKNEELAKQNIDLLGILKEKTKGNLTKEEEELMEGLLTQVRLKFVEAFKK